ncbi:unnamed protein product [Auanema sp. JU1783]|nr:unnamed protein product [Auanema sp. JU1783]
MASEVTSRKKFLNIKDTRIAGLYDLDYTIGQGHFAVVKLARHVFTGEKVACKIIDKTNLDPVSEAHIMQEVRCMKLVQHPNIVRLYEVIDTQSKLFLCLELGDYDMHDFIVRHEKGVAEPLAQQYFSQIITAIDYCHRLHVVHRDLKPENVVFFEKIGMVKLTDFGFSNLYEPGKPLLTSCGSLAYSAPEILLGDAYDAPAVDVWSLGVILFMLVCGRLPFQEANDSETLTRILDCKYSLPDSLSTSCKNLIQRMLVREPSKRANLPEIVQNSWVSAGDRGHASALPLIVQHELPHSAHTTIVEQMVAGNIASEDEILSALENDEYNSLTATYYLLAERILSTCREEKAKELMAKECDPIPDEEPIESEKTGTPAVPGSRCRSRSNSWRARPCTILKEESEEELSSYLKSSRQSSRQLSMDIVHSSCSLLSREHGEDGQLNRVEQQPSESADRPTFLLFGRTPTNFDDLSPILEDKDNVLEPVSQNGEKSSEHLACNARRTRFLRNLSEPERFTLEEERIGSHNFNKSIRGLVRRNSSPSVSMFSGSAKDRISPQAVHDLLEFSRLGNSRRAASPDSIRSSRSPSPPPSSSGRASPSISTLSSFARLKVAPASSSSGMRKLSSSPHLLGICEEGEEGGDSSFSSSLLTSPTDGLARTNRSASTGLVHLTRHGPVQPSKSTGSTQQPTTYSAVRMIRPRHAVVSPDVCRRYEQHQRFIARSRRSTSCSSSEASDDEEGKRLSLIASKYCNRKNYDNDKEDDDKGEGGQNGSTPSNRPPVPSLSKPSDSEQKSDGSKVQDKRSGPSDSCVPSGSLQQLLPILEMPQLDSDKGQRMRARLLQRSHTAERILRDWAGSANNSPSDGCLGTPPREVVKPNHEVDGHQEWIKRLRRTRSDIDIRALSFTLHDNKLCSEDSSSDAVFDFSESSSEEYLESRSDSGCSSGKEQRKEGRDYSKYAKHNCLESIPIFDLTHCEKPYEIAMFLLRTLQKQRKFSSTILFRQSSQNTFLKWPLPSDSFHGDSKHKFSESILKLEKHWKDQIENDFVLRKKSESGNKAKKYVLSMFPYPSGVLHMGHMRVYTISDVTARYYRLNGFNVIHPIGWDAFGLPAENAARDRKVDPKEWTVGNIKTMKEQLLRTGVQFDWERELFTCESDYYKWTQWIFCRLFEKGLLKRNLAEVNWDPVDGTVLAAEQIDSEGRSWRSGVKAEKKKLRQWLIETPRYAKRLSEGLKKVENWHDVADIQSNWIGRCDVRRFMFPIKNDAGEMMEELLDLRLKDAHAISNGWFVVLRQGHSLSDPTKKDSLDTYLLPIKVLNGVNGSWMSVVVVPKSYDGPEMFLDSRLGDSVVDEQLISRFQLGNPKKVMPMTMNDIEEIASFGGFGGYETSRTLQDWVVSRQRKWGTPIPMVISPDGKKACPLANTFLPLIQGTVDGSQKIPCDQFSDGYGFIETDTLDTFFDSAWYYLRYLDPKNDNFLISKEATTDMPVDVYVGGVEHAAVHMFFARFISYFLTDIGVTNFHEPFKHLIPQGIVRGKTFVVPETGLYVKPEEVIWTDSKPKTKNGEILSIEYEKMSKSKHNGVDPLSVLNRDGIDMIRLQLLEAAAPRQAINWGESDTKGLKKWLDRVAWVVSTYIEQRSPSNTTATTRNVEATLKETYNYFVRNISMCLEVLHLHNTALARLQGMTNALRKTDPHVLGSSEQAERLVHALVTMLQIYAPHTATELWKALISVETISKFKRNESIALQPWPEVDDDCDIDFTLMINGISAGRVSTPRKEVENLSFPEAVERSRNVEHKDFLQRIATKGVEVTYDSVSKREGFHLTINATVRSEEDVRKIQKTLDEIQFEKRKSVSKTKKEKKSKK